jgi:uncharacterized protein (DUF427 family)
VLKDVVWYYDRPIMESAKIEGKVFPLPSFPVSSLKRMIGQLQC